MNRNPAVIVCNSRMATSNNINPIRVRVFFFGAARNAAGHGQVEIELPSSCHAANAFERVLMAYPALRRFGRSLLFAVNQEYALGDREIHDGDELAVFPPVSGGGGANHDRTRTQPLNTGNARASAASTPNKDFFELTTDPIEVGAIARRDVLPE